MTDQEMTSNLSRIRPKLRTEGRVSGNFGRNKVKAANNAQLGLTSRDSIHRLVTPDEYIARLYDAFDKTTDTKLRQFIYTQIRQHFIQRGQWAV